MKFLRRAVWSLAMVLAALAARSVAAEAAPAVAAKNEISAEVREKLMVLVGHPDLKPGVAATKAAALAWSRKFILEEYDGEHLRANLTVQNGQMMLPYGVCYRFADGKITEFALESRTVPPDVDALRRQNLDDQPWVLIDRSVYGYHFSVAPSWPFLFEQLLDEGGQKFRFTVVGMPKVHDPVLEAWIENSVQWCEFRPDKPFKKLKDVIAAEEKRLKAMDTTIDKREPTDRADTMVYSSTYNGVKYRGMSRYFLFPDGRGLALRFNATPATYVINLPRFERFLKGFVVDPKRADRPDSELVRDGTSVIEFVGDVLSDEERRDMAERTRRGEKTKAEVVIPGGK